MKIQELKAIFILGVKSNQTFSEKRDIIFLNQSNFVLVLVMLCIAFANIFLGSYFRSLISLLVVPCLVLAFFLQQKKQYHKAKILSIATVLTATFLVTLFFGTETQTQFYIFPIFCLSVMLFRKRSEHIKLSIIHFAVAGFLLTFLNYYPPLFAEQQVAALSYLHIPMIFFLTFIVLSEYSVHYKRYEKRINELMHHLNENSELLELEKGKLQVQTGMLEVTNSQLVKEINQKEVMEHELVESNESLEQFAYVASHDLKEPLRTIGSFSQLLKRRLDGKLDKETSEYFTFVIDGVQRMSNLLDDLLAFSRLNRQQGTMPVHLNDCLELTELKLKKAIEDSEGKLIIGEMPVVQASRTQMNQLLQNLVSNGLKFRKDEEAPCIEVTCEEQETHFLFSVKDNGIGISQEFQEKVFVIFQRLDKSQKIEGTGIGLAICKKIVQNHRGDIWVESTPGKGSTFYFTLPKAGGGFLKPKQDLPEVPTQHTSATAELAVME